MSWEVWEPGRFYRVPVVHGTWRGCTLDWVVIGPRHEDSAIIHFPDEHYHLDPRFVPANIWEWPEPLPRGSLSILRYFLAAPLCEVNNRNNNAIPLRHLGLRRRKMRRQVSAKLVAALFAQPSWGRKLREVYCGQHLRGTVCPHRGADLRGFQPGADGMVTCPLHGLRFSVEDN